MAERTDQRPSSSSSSTDLSNYDVFLSFSGADTRATFTAALYSDLDRAGIRTFMDEEELKKGDEIGPNLLKAIKESRISIPIFSLNYASSKWCLNELVQIMESRETMGQTVFPIFLYVNPRDVRKQTEDFGEKFQQLAKRFDTETVNSWKKAMKKAGELKGWHLQNVENGNESKTIQEVVKRAVSELNNAYLDVAKHPIGIDSRIEDMMRLLTQPNDDYKDFHIAGICGMGGIGKTTIAKAVFNQIFRSFEGSSFRENVSDDTQDKGLVYLQSQLLFDILQKELIISNVSRGKVLIKERLRAKKVLIVLDGVDTNLQLEALAGGSDWFGSGSRIIITTRDEHVLNVHQVKVIYEPKELDPDQSLQLFSKYAFREDQPPEDFMELAKEVVLTTGGLPLALEVLGSFLYDKEIPTEWESTLEKLKQIQPDQILEKLKISYDGLDNEEKSIFLDISCFFIGTNKEYAIDMWEGCSFSARIGIKNLIHKSLIKIGKADDLRMHDQLRDMGRQIVWKESPEAPRKRSRLWYHEEVVDVLKEHKGTRNVQGVLVKFAEEEEIEVKERRFNTKAFSTMSRLRLLQIDNAHIVGKFKHLPLELRWLSWRRCPLKFLPTNYHPEKLVVLDLSYSEITQVWNQNKLFEKLTVLDLCNCLHLTITPDFSSLPNLKRLILERCAQLEEIHESIGHLSRLVLLNLVFCTSLMELPSSICKLKCLQDLNLSYCRVLKRLPENLGSIESLTVLLIDYTDIEELPNSVGLLKSLRRLSLKQCDSLRALPDLFHGSPNKLEVLEIAGCYLISKLPDSIGSLINITTLSLDRTIITELPDEVGLLDKLEILSLRGCQKLVKLSDSIGKLKLLRRLNMEQTGIIELPEAFGTLSSLEELYMSHCREFKVFSKNFGSLVQLSVLDVDYNSKLSTLPDSLSCLHSLTKLNANQCNLSEAGIPSDFWKLSSLKLLELGGNNFCSLPASIGGLPRLEEFFLINCSKLQSMPELPSSLTLLDAKNCVSLESLLVLSKLEYLKGLYLANCKKLQSLSQLPSSLTTINVSGCRSLERLPDLSRLKLLKEVYIDNCKKLAEIQGIDDLKSVTYFYMGGCSSTLRNRIVQELGFARLQHFVFSGGDIPDWFTPLKVSDGFFWDEEEGVFSDERVIKLEYEDVATRLANPQHREIIGVILCFVFTSREEDLDLCLTVNGTRNGDFFFSIHEIDLEIPKACRNQIYMCQDDKFVSVLEGRAEISFWLQGASERKFRVKKGGMHVIYKENKEDSTQQSTFKRIADFFVSSYDDGVVRGEGSRSRKRKVAGYHAKTSKKTRYRINQTSPFHCCRALRLRAMLKEHQRRVNAGRRKCKGGSRLHRQALLLGFD